MKPNLSAYVEMMVALVLFGSLVVVSKLVTLNFPVFLATAARLAIATLILAPLLLATEGRPGRIGRRDWLYLALLALSVQVLFGVFLLYGLRYTGAANAGIVLATLPAVTAVIGIVLLRERMTGRVALALLLAVAGVMVLRGGAAGAITDASALLGFGLVFLAVVADAAAIILAKMISDRLSALAIMTIVSVLGLLAVAPLAAWEAVSFDFAAVTATEVGYILYYGAIATALASYLWIRGIRKVSGAIAGVFTSIMPVSAVFLSYVVLAEPVGLAHGIGLAAVLAAILLIARDQSSKTSPGAPA